MIYSLWIVSNKNRMEDIPYLYQAEEDQAANGLVKDKNLPLAGSDLLELFPSLESLSDDDIDDSPWSNTPEVTGYWIHLSIRYSKVDLIFEKAGQVFENYKRYSKKEK